MLLVGDTKPLLQAFICHLYLFQWNICVCSLPIFLYYYLEYWIQGKYYVNAVLRTLTRKMAVHVQFRQHLSPAAFLLDLLTPSFCLEISLSPFTSCLLLPSRAPPLTPSLKPSLAAPVSCFHPLSNLFSFSQLSFENASTMPKILMTWSWTTPTTMPASVLQHYYGLKARLVCWHLSLLLPFNLTLLFTQVSSFSQNGHHGLLNLVLQQLPSFPKRNPPVPLKTVWGHFPGCCRKSSAGEALA